MYFPSAFRCALRFSRSRRLWLYGAITVVLQQLSLRLTSVHPSIKQNCKSSWKISFPLSYRDIVLSIDSSMINVKWANYYVYEVWNSENFLYFEERLMQSYLYFRNLFEKRFKSHIFCKSASMSLIEYLCSHFSAKQSKMYEAIDGGGYSEE